MIASIINSIMKIHLNESHSEYFFHQYLVGGSVKKERIFTQFDISEQLNDSSAKQFSPSFHKCRLFQVGEENIAAWPLHILKAVTFQPEKLTDQSDKLLQMMNKHDIKKLSQVQTEYLCYQMMRGSHRVVRMLQIIVENSQKSQEQEFFYRFLRRKKLQGFESACFVLENCNDGTLQDRIYNDPNPLTGEDIVMYCCQILEGLLELKKKGILHRSLRPCNIFLHNREVKFGEFDSAFIYNESECLSLREGIDMNASPSELVELASKSDQELEAMGNLHLYQLQFKCDTYSFGTVIYNMVFKRSYKKNYYDTDLDCLVHQKVKEGFSCPELLFIMKSCLQSNPEKRIDFADLFEQFRALERERYFSEQSYIKTYLSEDPLIPVNCSNFAFRKSQKAAQIPNSINLTLDFHFQKAEHDFRAAFKKATLVRNTQLYADQALRVLAKFRRNRNSKIWACTDRVQYDRFERVMEQFVVNISIRICFYEYMLRVLLKLSMKGIGQTADKIINNRAISQELSIMLEFLYDSLGRAPFKFDRHYSERSLAYETRNLFKHKAQIHIKHNFFKVRSNRFMNQNLESKRLIEKFYQIKYENEQLDNFEGFYKNFMDLVTLLDMRISSMLKESVSMLFRSYEALQRSDDKRFHLRNYLFVLIVLENQSLSQMQKSIIVELKQTLEPLSEETRTLDEDNSEMFFESYKKLNSEQAENLFQKKNNDQSLVSQRPSDVLSGMALHLNNNSQKCQFDPTGVKSLIRGSISAYEGSSQSNYVHNSGQQTSVTISNENQGNR